MSGNDTLTINNRLFTGEADANIIELTFANKIANLKTGKNGNSIYGFNATGLQAELKLRLIRGSADDKFMQQLLNLQNLSFDSFVLMIGTFTKFIGNGQGAVLSDVYILSGGIFSKSVPGKSNVEGDTEQSVAMYELEFAAATRALT